MFTEYKLEGYAKLLGLNISELNSFMKRYKSYIESKETLTKNVLINGLFILEDIINEKWKNEALEIKYSTKNLVILKYQEEIVELYMNGMGTTRIANYMLLNHKVKLSKSALDRFISGNNIERF